MLPLLVTVLPTRSCRREQGRRASPAMMTVDLGSTAGRISGTIVYPAVLTAGQPPAMALPPPAASEATALTKPAPPLGSPAPGRQPRAIGGKHAAALPSGDTRRANRTAYNQGASAEFPGRSARRLTRGSGSRATERGETSRPAGGTTGNGGDMLHRRRTRGWRGGCAAAHRNDLGHRTISFSAPTAYRRMFYGGQKVWIKRTSSGSTRTTMDSVHVRVARHQ